MSLQVHPCCITMAWRAAEKRYFHVCPQLPFSLQVALIRSINKAQSSSRVAFFTRFGRQSRSLDTLIKARTHGRLTGWISTCAQFSVAQAYLQELSRAITPSAGDLSGSLGESAFPARKFGEADDDLQARLSLRDRSILNIILHQSNLSRSKAHLQIHLFTRGFVPSLVYFLRFARILTGEFSLNQG